MLPWLKKESQQSTPVEKSWIKKLAAMFMFIINLALSTKALKFTMFSLLFLKYTISKTQGFVWKGKKSLVLLLIKLISNGFSWQFEFSLEKFFSLVWVEQVSWVCGAGGRFGEPQLHRWTPVGSCRLCYVSDSVWHVPNQIWKDSRFSIYGLPSGNFSALRWWFFWWIFCFIIARWQGRRPDIYIDVKDWLNCPSCQISRLNWN